MNNELVQASRKALANSNDQSFSRVAGGALVKTGSAGLGLWVLAGILPLVTLPMLLVLAVVFGAFLYVKD